MIIKRVYPKDFEAIKKCEKPFEIVIADKKVKIGEKIIIKEWDPKLKQDTGKVLIRKILSVNKVDLNDYFFMGEVSEKGILVLEI